MHLARRGAESRSILGGPDGTVWAYLVDYVGGAKHPDRQERYLARYDGTSWMLYSKDDGVPDVIQYDSFGHLAVGPDGTAYIAGNGEGSVLALKPA